MHSMLVAPGDRGGEGQGALTIWKIEDKDELVFSLVADCSTGLGLQF